ncbi:Replication factor A protein 1 [Entamoeba marina]
MSITPNSAEQPIQNESTTPPSPIELLIQNKKIDSPINVKVLSLSNLFTNPYVLKLKISDETFSITSIIKCKTKKEVNAIKHHGLIKIISGVLRSPINPSRPVFLVRSLKIINNPDEETNHSSSSSQNDSPNNSSEETNNLPSSTNDLPNNPNEEINHSLPSSTNDSPNNSSEETNNLPPSSQNDLPNNPNEETNHSSSSTNDLPNNPNEEINYSLPSSTNGLSRIRITPFQMLVETNTKFKVKGVVVSKSEKIKYKGNYLFKFIIQDKDGYEMECICFQDTCDRYYDIIKENVTYCISKGNLQPQENNSQLLQNNTFKTDRMIDLDCIITSYSIIQESNDAIQRQSNIKLIKDLENCPVNSLCSICCIIYSIGETCGDKSKRVIKVVDHSGVVIEIIFYNDLIQIPDEFKVGDVVQFNNLRVTEFGFKNMNYAVSSSFIFTPGSDEIKEFKQILVENNYELLNTQRYNELSNTQNCSELSNTQNCSELSNTQNRFEFSNTQNCSELSNTQNYSELSNTQNCSEPISQPITITVSLKEFEENARKANGKPVESNVTVYITAFRTDSISYIGCNDCKKSVDNDVIVCPHCNNKQCKPQTLYNLKVNIQDSTNEIWGTMFDEVATEFFETSAKELIALKESNFDKYINTFKDRVFIKVTLGLQGKLDNKGVVRINIFHCQILDKTN